jgi:hypothetical protein
MTAPIFVEVHPYNATVRWQELLTPDNGRDVPVMYWLEWFDYDISQWVVLNSADQGKIF